jgi:hypothetical protein
MAKIGVIGSTTKRYVPMKRTKSVPTKPGGRKAKKPSRGQGRP